MSNLEESLPIFVRISEGIKDHILTGDLKENEQLPSTTQISRQYDVNIATVNKGYNILVAEGIVFKKKGIGMFVAEGSVKRLIEERRKTFKERYVNATLREAKRLRYTTEELQKIVAEAYDSFEKDQ